jgi:hypothetical protein
MSKVANALVAASTLWVTACGGNARSDQTSPEEPGACASQDVLLSGRVERDLETAFQYRGETFLGGDSLVTIGLHLSSGLGEGAPSTLIAQQNLSPAPAPPFDFCVTGSLPEDDTPGLEYYTSIYISQHGDPGTPTVGDLVNEYHNVVVPPARNITLRVVGLEACDGPDAGGWCATPP